MKPHLAGGGLLPGTIHDIGYQPEITRADLAGHHDRPVDTGMRAQGDLDFCGLDPKAANLYLPINSSHVDELPARQPTTDIAGPIEARANFSCKSVRDEPFGRKLRSPMIADRHPFPADPDLAWDADRHRLTCRIEDIYLSVGNRSPNADRLVVCRDLLDHRPDRGFRRTVDIPQ